MTHAEELEATAKTWRERALFTEDLEQTRLLADCAEVLTEKAAKWKREPDPLRSIRVDDYDPACSLCREQAGKPNANTGSFLCNAHALAIGRAALAIGEPSAPVLTVADLLAWFKARPGISWKATIIDIEEAVASITHTPCTCSPTAMAEGIYRKDCPIHGLKAAPTVGAQASAPASEQWRQCPVQHGSDHRMELQWVCETCGHREAANV